MGRSLNGCSSRFDGGAAGSVEGSNNGGVQPTGDRAGNLAFGARNLRKFRRALFPQGSHRTALVPRNLRACIASVAVANTAVHMLKSEASEWPCPDGGLSAEERAGSPAVGSFIHSFICVSAGAPEP